MIGKRHTDLLRSIDSYNTILLNAELRSVDFFIESTYKDPSGKENKSYLLTRKGCDMVANKMTGEKGILFTAAYVTQFEAMQEELSKPKVLSPKEQLMAAMQLTLETEREVATLKEDVNQLKDKVDNQITLDHGEQRRIQKLVAAKVYECSTSDAHRKALFPELHRELKDRFGVASYKDIKRHEMQKAINYIESWIPKKVVS